MITENHDGNWAGYKKILLPLGHKADINNLTNLTSYLIDKKQGDVELIHIMRQGNYTGLPKEWREGSKRVTESHHKMMRLGLHSNRKMTTAESIERGILEEAFDIEADSIILGWGPQPKSNISKMASKIMNNANCDVIVYKNRNDLDEVHNILYPIAFEPDPSRLNLISRIIEETGATLTIAHMIDRNSGSEKRGNNLLERAIEKAKEYGIEAESLLLKGKNVEVELGKVSEDYELLIIGPSGDWWVYQTLFGKKTDKIASKAKCSILLHKYVKEE